MRYKRLTKEEKVATKLADAVSDVTIDLDDVGRYLARTFTNVIFRRLDIIISSAQYEKEKRNGERPDYDIYQ